MPECAICQDAYGSRFVCESCRADEANVDWEEGREDSWDSVDGVAAEQVVPWGARPGDRGRLQRVAYILARGATVRDAAREAGCSVGFAFKVKGKLNALLGLA